MGPVRAKLLYFWAYMIKIYPKSKQASGSFNFGRILEHKPIGFPQDGGELKPYSSLFYWAHAWSDDGGLIDQHPHKGFEIMSYVLKGEIEHFDNKLNGWKKLKAGDVQVIRAGNGIVHAEKLLSGSAMFQIWFDPDLNKTLSQPASYNDHASSELPVTRQPGIVIKHVKGGNSPFNIESKVDFIQDWTVTGRTKMLDLDHKFIYSACVISGELEIDGKPLATGDFFMLQDLSEVSLNPLEKESRLFVIKTPKDIGFKTYFEFMTTNAKS